MSGSAANDSLTLKEPPQSIRVLLSYLLEFVILKINSFLSKSDFYLDSLHYMTNPVFLTVFYNISSMNSGFYTVKVHNLCCFSVHTT